MDSELEGDGGRGRVGSESKSYSAIFEKFEPIYMTYGMSFDEYWNGDNEAVRGYRRAFEQKRDIRNFDMWLQGKYIYDTLCAVAPIYRAFSKAKKPIDYLDAPYPLSEKQAEARQAEKEKRQYDKMMEQMKAFTAEFNKKFEKGGKGNG